MTFREFMVLLKLYHAAPTELRAWAEKQLPELREAAELTTETTAHRVVGRIDAPWNHTISIKCSCDRIFTGAEDKVFTAFNEHARNDAALR